MLLRQDFHKILRNDQEGVILKHFLRAVQLRIKFSGLKLSHTKKLLLPSCHEVAHAYARAFDVQVEDGLCVYISGMGIETGEDETFPLSSRFMHSWNVITLHTGECVLLDIFPDMGPSMMPMLFPYPHPAYYIPNDSAFLSQLNEIKHSRDFDTTVELLSDAFRAFENATRTR